MDPAEDLPPPPAFFPPPAPAADAPPPAPTAASLSGPKIFVFSPLPGNRYDADWYFYSPAADVTEGDYAALITFAAHYGHPLVIYQYPNIVAFQEFHPSAIIRPFSEVPPSILQRGHELQSSSGASSASQPGGSASASTLSDSSPQGSSRGHDPPSIAAATRASSTTLSRHASLPPPPRHSDPDGVNGPSSVSGGMEGMGGPRFVGRSSSSYGFYPSSLSARVSRLPPRLSIFASFTSQVPFPRQFLRSSLVVTIIPHLLGFFVMLLHLLSTIIMRLQLWHLRLHLLLCRCILCLKRISLLFSASDLTMSFLAPNTSHLAVPSAPPPPPPGVTPPAPVPSSSQLVLSPTAVPLRPLEPFKLPVIKDSKAYLDVHGMIQYYLRQPEYATQHSDESLVTTPSNVMASLFWEGQLRNAVREGSLRFLFDNKGTLYHGKGFEMLAVLDQHCRPNTIANAFSTLMSLFNDVQGPSEPVLGF
jgi:hypothetical protein